MVDIPNLDSLIDGYEQESRSRQEESLRSRRAVRDRQATDLADALIRRLVEAFSHEDVIAMQWRTFIADYARIGGDGPWPTCGVEAMMEYAGGRLILQAADPQARRVYVVWEEANAPYIVGKGVPNWPASRPLLLEAVGDVRRGIIEHLITLRREAREHQPAAAGAPG